MSRRSPDQGGSMDRSRGTSPCTLCSFSVTRCRFLLAYDDRVNWARSRDLLAFAHGHVELDGDVVVLPRQRSVALAECSSSQERVVSHEPVDDCDRFTLLKHEA